MRRLRSDLSILTGEQFAKHIGHLEGYLNLDENERVHWIEECRQDGLLEGFVVSRGEHSALRYKSRRHTLGMQRENPERTHFVPPPLYGFTLLVSRKGFAHSKTPPVTDSGAFLSHRIESALLDSLPEHLQEITGIFVEQRKFKTILKEAQRSAGTWERNGREIDEAILELCDENEPADLVDLEQYIANQGFSSLLNSHTHSSSDEDD